jgi:hypothetical protein
MEVLYVIQFQGNYIMHITIIQLQHVYPICYACCSMTFLGSGSLLNMNCDSVLPLTVLVRFVVDVPGPR